MFNTERINHNESITNIGEEKYWKGGNQGQVPSFAKRDFFERFTDRKSAGNLGLTRMRIYNI